jgi:hypothetical protein
VPVTDAAPTRIALVWRVERDDADIQEFVGVVRGRTTRSSRGGADDGATDSTGDARARGASAGTGSKSGGAGRPGAKGRGTGRAASARSGRTARKRGGRGR